MFFPSDQSNRKRKMEALKKLATLKENKPYHGFPKLAVGYHNILNLRTVKNKFSKKGEPTKTILVELEKEFIFLPSYFWQKVNEKDMTDLNALIESGYNTIIYLYFGGWQEEGEYVSF